MEKLKIFISGTQDDMKPEREAVDRAVNATTLATGIRAETAVSQPQSPRAWIEQQLRECNIYIGVYSHRYGWVIPGENVSATGFEFNLARKLGKTILVWIRNVRENENDKHDFDKQEQFLKRVSDFSSGYLRQVFDTPADLESWITAALGETFTEIIRRGTAPTTSKFLVPFPHNPDFVGRDADLATLHAMLQQGNSPVGIRPTVLVGLGGIGKTQLAVEYAHAHRADYPDGVFWLNAINPLLFEFAKLAELLELANTDTPRDTATQRCYEHLNQHTDALVIFDNVEEPRNLNVPFTAGLIPANLQCRTLFTTRKRDFPNQFQPFEVKTLPEEAAMQLLLRHSSRQPILEPNHPNHGLARVICITLGYLPLALALAGAFLGEYTEVSLFHYRMRLLDEGAIEVVDANELRSEDMPTRHETAVRATLKTSWDALTDENARLALRAAGQLREAELIPISRLGLLTGLATEAKPGHPVSLTQALKKLYAASLIEELTADQLRLHPLVHTFAARLSEPTLRAEMVARIDTKFGDLATVQANVIQRGIDDVLDDLRTGLELSSNDKQKDSVYTRLSRLERVLDREAHHLRHWDPNEQASFFLQQFRNRSLELGYADLQSRAETQLANWKLSYLLERLSVTRESEELVRTLKGHADWVNGVAVTTDGHWAISASSDHTIKVWDLATGKTVRTLEGHTKPVTAVVLTKDGRWVISASEDATLRVWDLATGETIRMLEEHSKTVSAVALTADGGWAVSASKDKTLEVWNLVTGKVVRTLKGHKGSVNGVAVTADGRLAISASEDATLRVWNLATGRTVRKLEKHGASVNAVAVTSDGCWAISASADTSLKLWNLATRKQVRTLKGHTDSVIALAITEDGRRAISASSDNTLRVWDLATGKTVRTLEGHTDSVTAVTVTADGRWAISASKDKTLRVWDLATVETARAFEGQVGSVNAVAVAANGRWAISASSDPDTLDNTLKVWDLATGETVHTLKEHTGWGNAVTVTSDGRWVISALGDYTLEVWNLATGKTVRTLEGHTDLVHGVAVTADGRWAISASEDGTLKLWNLATGETIRTLEGHTDSVDAVAMTGDGRWAISASQDKTLRVWNLATGETVRMLVGPTYWVVAVAVTMDGQRAVTASSNFSGSTLKVWNLATGKMVRLLEGYTNEVKGVAVTANGRWAISASSDNTLRVWNLYSGRCTLTLATDAPLKCCAIVPDGKTIVAGDEAGAVHVVEWVNFEEAKPNSTA